MKQTNEKLQNLNKAIENDVAQFYKTIENSINLNKKKANN